MTFAQNTRFRHLVELSNAGSLTVGETGSEKDYYTFYADTNGNSDKVWTIKILDADGKKAIKTYEIAFAVTEKAVLATDICSKKDEMEAFYKKASKDDNIDVTDLLPENVNQTGNDWLSSNPPLLFIYVDKGTGSPAASLNGKAFKFRYKIDDGEFVDANNPFKEVTDLTKDKFAALLGGTSDPYVTFGIDSFATPIDNGTKITFETTLIVDSEEVTEGEGEEEKTTTKIIKAYTSTVTRTFGEDLF